MYNVVEFAEEGGGGVSLIRREWLTPQKQRCMWPPQRLMTKFNKCIDGSIVADINTWEIFNIKRVFYETDSLVKAREKAKQAEIESEVNSDHNESVRRRKKTRKIYESDTSDGNSDDNDDNAIVYPTPPATKLGFNTKTPSVVHKKSSKGEIYKYQKQVAATVHSTPHSSTDDEYITEKSRKHVVSSKVCSTPSTSADEECATHRIQMKVQNSEASLQSLGSLDLTVTPFLKETPISQALDVIAKHLARIETDIRELQISQQEILQRLRSSSSTPLEYSLPDGITLPCDDNEAMIKIESWINTTTENKKLLVTYLSLVGGNKTPVIIRRILEKLFTNKLAILCNWTGKNNKIPLKDLELIKIIRDAVRQNQIAANATDAEIHEVISNWFRFTKDRNGGREARRVKQ